MRSRPGREHDRVRSSELGRENLENKLVREFGATRRLQASFRIWSNVVWMRLEDYELAS